MAENIYLPRLGQTMTEGKIMAWLRKDGDSVEKGDELYTLEYDKATINVESSAGGTLKILVADEETVSVGTIVAKILEGDEDIDAIEDSPAIKEGKVKAEVSMAGVAKNVPRKKVNISPIARRLAEEYGVDITKVVPSVASGRISKEDILRYRDRGQKSKSQDAQDQRDIKKVALSGIRKVIAQRMVESAFTAPTVTYSSDVDMFELKNFRVQLNEKLAKDNIKISFTDLIIKAVAKALQESPNINVRLKDNNIYYIPEINVGVAVAIENGLIVPVIKNAHKISIEEISKITKELAKKARNNSLRPDEITGGTFTVTNLGVNGIDMFTPIINQPESAILGIGRIIEKPVVIEKKIEIRPMMVLSLTADHRVIDGAPAAQFLFEVKKIIEQPSVLV